MSSEDHPAINKMRRLNADLSYDDTVPKATRDLLSVQLHNSNAKVSRLMANTFQLAPKRPIVTAPQATTRNPRHHLPTHCRRPEDRAFGWFHLLQGSRLPLPPSLQPSLPRCATRLLPDPTPSLRISERTRHFERRTAQRDPTVPTRLRFLAPRVGKEMHIGRASFASNEHSLGPPVPVDRPPVPEPPHAGR